MKKSIVIAIDGVSGSGKSTLARTLARRLGFAYLDTGAMYRALTYKALNLRLDFSNGAGLYAPLRSTRLRLSRTGSRVWMDSKEVTRPIRNVKVSQHVSLLASVPNIRHWMVRMQRAMAKGHSVVMEGRDIGTVVFPKAQVKFFVVASLEERAKRRLEELRAMGTAVDRATILKNLAARDKQDSEREVSPLRRAPGAILIDSTNMTMRQKTDHALAIVREQLAAR